MAATLLISLEKIKPFAHNVRSTEEDTDDQLSLLAEDIRENGLLHPVTVRQTESGLYEVIAGQRRCAACAILEWESIPATVIDADDGQSFLISLSENMHRRPMSNREKCVAISRCYSECDENVQRVANITHLSASTVRRYLQIAELPDDIVDRLDAVGDQKITLSDAYDMAKAQTQQPEEEESVQPDKPPRARSIKADPWVFDENDKPVAIPQALYASVYAMVQRTLNDA